MSKTVSLHELAELELNDAADFYDSREAGLGSEFVREVQKAVRQLSEYPESAPLVKGDARVKVLRKFPYNIIYFVTPETIRLLAIASQSRRPFYWIRRTQHDG
jgi:plasmid stabilization system protein ParE